MPFIQFFKGIHVRTADVNATGQGVIMSFNLLAGMSKLTFYYTNDGDTTKRTANFEINSTVRASTVSNTTTPLPSLATVSPWPETISFTCAVDGRREGAVKVSKPDESRCQRSGVG
jgi:hypothetical protein